MCNIGTLLYRLLKVDRRLTLGIGDNREHCFYIPVGFHLIRLYIDQGFELEELVRNSEQIMRNRSMLMLDSILTGYQEATLLFRFWIRNLSLCSIRFFGIYT